MAISVVVVAAVAVVAVETALYFNCFAGAALQDFYHCIQGKALAGGGLSGSVFYSSDFQDSKISPLVILGLDQVVWKASWGAVSWVARSF